MGTDRVSTIDLDDKDRANPRLFCPHNGAQITQDHITTAHRVTT
jgi:hypothetical protein